jgi:hypothetical protein
MKPNSNFFLHIFSFLLLTSIALLTACSSTQRHPVSSYSSYLNDSQVVGRQNVPISDEQAASQRAGTTRTRQTDSSETVTKKGQIKKQTTTTAELIETDTSTVVDTFSVPTSDQDAR